MMRAVRDMVDYKEFIVYELNLPQHLKDMTPTQLALQSISFDLEPFYGNPDLYIHYDFQPSERINYKWKSTQHDGLESLTITFDELIQVNATITKFYVGVFGESSATFRLLAYLSDAEDRDLVFDCTESGYIKKGDIVNYQLYVYELKSTHITITLSTITGATELFMKRCDGDAEGVCRVTQDDINNKANLNQPIFYSG